MVPKKRLFNIRICFAMFVGIFSGILSLSWIFNIVFINIFNLFQSIFVLIFFAVFVFLFFVIFYKKVDLKKYLKYVIAFLICFVIGVGSFGIKFSIIARYPTFNGAQSITGTICGYGYQENSYKIILTNVKVGETKLKSKVAVYAYLNGDVPKTISLGDEVSFSGKIEKKSLCTTTLNFDTYSSNQVYACQTTITNIALTDKKPNFIYAFQDKVRHLLDDNLNEDNSIFAYSVLFGEKSRISDDIRNAFSFSGLSHILAVSGLHVGFLAGLIYFIIGLFKGGRKTKFFVTTPILLLYCVMCNFTPSVVRATIMSTVFMFADLIGMQYDPLSSLSFSAVVILMFSPLSLFNLGFQLSFMCVFVIITLANRMSKVLINRLHFPKWVAQTFAMSFCVTLGVLPLCANVLGEVSIMSIFSNMVAIPLFAVTYPVLVICVLLGCIWTKLGILLAVPGVFLHAILIVVNFFAGLNFSHFRLYNLGYLIVFVFVILCLICRFMMIRLKIKSIICLSLAIVCSVFLIFGAKSTTYKTYSMITCYQYNSVSAVLTTADNKKILVGYDDYSVDDTLWQAKIARLDSWILPVIEVNNIEFYEEFLQKYKVKNLVLPRENGLNSYAITRLAKYTNIHNADDQTAGGCGVKFLTYNGVCGGVEIDINGKSLLFMPKTTRATLSAVNRYNLNVDYLIINSCKHNIDSEYTIGYETLIYHNEIGFDNDKTKICMENKDYFVVKL